MSSCAAMSSMVLSGVLNSIHASEIPVEEKRRLAARAVDAAMARGTNDKPPGQAHIQLIQLEQALHTMAVQAGVNKLSISDGKAWLRPRGPSGVALASRLSKLSKVRNGVAHPDVGLVHDIGLLGGLSGLQGADSHLGNSLASRRKVGSSDAGPVDEQSHTCEIGVGTDMPVAAFFPMDGCNDGQLDYGQLDRSQWADMVDTPTVTDDEHPEDVSSTSCEDDSSVGAICESGYKLSEIAHFAADGSSTLAGNPQTCRGKVCADGVDLEELFRDIVVQFGANSTPADTLAWKIEELKGLKDG